MTKTRVRYVNEVYPGATFELKEDPVPRRGIMQLAPGQGEDGYGKKIHTDYMLLVNGTWHRVYAICFSNAASHYITTKSGTCYYLGDAFLSGLRDRWLKPKKENR